MLACSVGWNLEIVPVGDDLAIIFPEEFLEQAGWKVGDLLDYEVKDRRLLLRERDKQLDA